MQLPTAIGGAVTGLVYLFGPVSLANLNPTVSLVRNAAGDRAAASTSLSPDTHKTRVQRVGALANIRVSVARFLISEVWKGVGGRGLATGKAKISTNSSPELCPPSPKGGLGKRVQKEAESLVQRSRRANPPVCQPLFETCENRVKLLRLGNDNMHGERSDSTSVVIEMLQWRREATRKHVIASL